MGIKANPAVVGTARVKTREWTDQAGGPQENGNRHAAETVGARNEHSGSATGVESGARQTIGAAASAGMEANWQMEQ